MTLGTLAEELATEMGEPYSDLDVSRIFEQWVSEAIEELYHAEQWEFSTGTTSFVSVAGTATYTMGTTVGSVRIITDRAAGLVLEGRTRESLMRAGADLTLSGTPEAWCLESADPTTGALIVRLWKVPTSVLNYDVLYTKLPATLSTASVIPLPPDTLRAVRHAVRAMYYENEGERPDAVQRARASYEEALEALRRRYLWHTGANHRVRFGDLSRQFAGFPVPRLPRSVSS
jgi:hypothetical protein